MKARPAQALALAVLGLGVGQGAGAQPAGPDAPAPAAPQRVEITAREETDTDRRRREPVAKTVVGREELDRYGDSSIVDVLKRQPGVNLQGGNPRLRGLGSGYTLILVNGEPAPPGFSLDNLPPSQVERIEISKGPSAEHSAQAVAGTINIILRQAPRQRQRELRAGLNYQAENPVPTLNGLWADRLGDVSATLPFAAYRWRGAADSQGQRLTRDTAGAPQQLATQATERWWGGGYNLGPRLAWRVDEQLTLEAQGWAQRNDFRNAGHTDTAVLAGSTPSSVSDDWASQGHWRVHRGHVSAVQRGTAGQRLELRLGAQRSDGNWTSVFLGDDAQGRRQVVRQSDNRHHDTSRTASAKLSWPLGDSHRLLLGAEGEHKARHEQRTVVENGVSQLLGFDGEPFQARVQRTAAYLQDEWEPVPRWGATLGLRAERISTRSAGGDGLLSSSSQVVTPMLHAVHRLQASGRDQVRASLTRSYKAPELAQLMARPSINASYPVSGPNAELAPDRVGNPALRPELSTGLDLALERYGAQGGVFSVGVFHRRISGLMRNRTALETVAWSAVPRWVSRPVNLQRASSTGVELEVKGRLDEALGVNSGPWRTLALRGSLAVYRSTVSDLPGPDNRLDGQQPWSLTLGADHAWPGTPLTWGLSLALTPAYAVQQTEAQRLQQGRARTLDAYALWALDRQTSLRLSIGNLRPLAQRTQTTVVETGGFVQEQVNTRQPRASLNLGLTHRF